MKVKAVQFVPLGRPPKGGEWAQLKENPKEGSFMLLLSGDDPEWEAFERREVEVEVPEAVPEWIDHFVEGMYAPSWSQENRDACKKNCAEHFRKHVDRCAKATGDALYTKHGASAAADAERIIRESFL